MTATDTRLTISVPVPPRELSKNGRLNPWLKNSMYQHYKRVAVSEINRQLTARWEPYTGPVIITAHWYVRRKPFPDSDNAIERLAAYRDAAQDTGLIANDNQITDTQVRFALDADNPRVELTFVFTPKEDV